MNLGLKRVRLGWKRVCHLGKAMLEAHREVMRCEAEVPETLCAVSPLPRPEGAGEVVVSHRGPTVHLSNTRQCVHSLAQSPEQLTKLQSWSLLESPDCGGR